MDLAGSCVCDCPKPINKSHLKMGHYPAMVSYSFNVHVFSGPEILWKVLNKNYFKILELYPQRFPSTPVYWMLIGVLNRIETQTWPERPDCARSGCYPPGASKLDSLRERILRVETWDKNGRLPALVTRPEGAGKVQSAFLWATEAGLSCGCCSCHCVSGSCEICVS